ncbi:MAG: hypothetical protein PVF87_06525 [Acidimicrobiia bacterium]
MWRVIRVVLLGAVSGAVGTLFMDLLWFWRFRTGGGSQSFIPWETSEGVDGYEDAPAPAETAKAIAGLLKIDLASSSARIANNLVHWLTGISWGGALGVVALVLGTANPALGLLMAVIAWATSYVVLPRLGVYKPMGEYDRAVLWQDFSAHLVYGVALGLTFWAMSMGSFA